MNSLVVKAICRRIEDRYGSNRAVALAAGVSGGVWSNYASDDHPDTTIPFHRLLLIANAAERKAFADLLLGEQDRDPGDLVTETAEVTEAAAELQAAARNVGRITPFSKRALRQMAVGVQAQAAEAVAAIDAA
jgi:hypothetical protein